MIKPYCLLKLSDAEGDYCDPIDVQRRDDFIQEMTSKPIKDDYCEPWDSTIKSDATNASSKKLSNSDDENNEYLDPYDTGKEGIIEQRMSRAIGVGAQHGRGVMNEQRRSAIEVDPKNPAFDARFVLKRMLCDENMFCNVILEAVCTTSHIQQMQCVPS